MKGLGLCVCVLRIVEPFGVYVRMCTYVLRIVEPFCVYVRMCVCVCVCVADCRAVLSLRYKKTKRSFGK